MRSAMSDIKDTNDFLSKLKNWNKLPEAITVTASVIGLCCSIPQNEGLEILKKQLDNFDEKLIRAEDLVPKNGWICS